MYFNCIYLCKLYLVLLFSLFLNIDYFLLAILLHYAGQKLYINPLLMNSNSLFFGLNLQPYNLNCTAVSLVASCWAHQPTVTVHQVYLSLSLSWVKQQNECCQVIKFRNKTKHLSLVEIIQIISLDRKLFFLCPAVGHKCSCLAAIVELKHQINMTCGGSSYGIL